MITLTDHHYGQLETMFPGCAIEAFSDALGMSIFISPLSHGGAA